MSLIRSRFCRRDKPGQDVSRGAKVLGGEDAKYSESGVQVTCVQPTS